MPRKIIISAMDENRLIGTDHGHGLPWDLPDEYGKYLAKVAGQTVIMGRATYVLSGQDLTSKHTIVVSRNFPPSEDYIVCKSLDDALKKAESFGKDIFIAGGGTIYSQTLDKADYMHLTYIKGKYEGTTYFPEVDFSKWIEEKREQFLEYEIVIYRKKPE